MTHITNWYGEPIIQSEYEWYQNGREIVTLFYFCYLSISVINLIVLSFLSFIDTASTWQFYFCYLSYQLSFISDSSSWPCINTINSYFETVARFCWIKSYLNSNFLKPSTLHCPTRSERIRSDVVRSAQIRSELLRSAQIWSESNQIWSDLLRFKSEQIWADATTIL